jgi:PAS domain S-box-containing protein/putative nucleotidyltransferase with HDIG domain
MEPMAKPPEETAEQQLAMAQSQLARYAHDFRETVQQLRASEQRFRGIVERSSDAIFTVDTEGRVTYASPAMERTTGLPAAELVGHHFNNFITPAAMPEALAAFNRMLGGDIIEGVELEMRRQDGTIFIALLNGSPVVEAGKVVGGQALYQDITRRKQAESAMQRLNRALAALSTCNSILIHATEEPQLLEEMCHNIVQQGNYHLVWIGLVEHDAEQRIRPVASAGAKVCHLESPHLGWGDNEEGQCPAGRAVRLGTTQLANDILVDPQDAHWRDEALRCGFASSIALPLKQEDDTVFGVLNIYAAEAHAFDDAEVRLLRELADDLAFGVLTLRTRQERSHYLQQHLKSVEQLKEALVSTIRAMALTVEKRDPYTAGHQSRVAALAMAIAVEMGVDENRVEGLRLGAMIHDIGKIYVPAEILNRPGKLSGPEFSMIKSHPEVGYDIIKGVEFPWPVADMVLQHHERMDGSGYPNGLRGEAIILEARILAVADVVEAITAHRPYRAGLGLATALVEIENGRGQLYDTAVADACLRLFREKGYTLTDDNPQ